MTVRRWAPYGLLLMVLGAALFVGAGDDSPSTPAARAAAIAADVRCPTCEGLSAAESESPAAQAVREEIRRRVDAGESAGQIKAFLAGRYGPDILLTPDAGGVASLVWVLPVAAVVLGAGGLVLAFRRWRAQPRRTATDADRRLVDQALGR